MIKNFIRLVLLTTLFILPIYAKTFKFAVVSKEANSPFFTLSKEGCMDAASSIDGVECIYKGPTETNTRLQDIIIEQLIQDGVDGIAVAVINSDFIAKNSIKLAKKAGIPIITYDSDFGQKHKNLRLSYIGSNNFDLGKALGNELKKIYPNGGLVCIQAGVKGTINLNSRIQGVRLALSNGDKLSLDERLNNPNGWKEYRRCPFYSWENRERASNQLDKILSDEEKISFIAVGGWAQYSKNYRNVIEKYKYKFINKDIAYISADTSNLQLELLKNSLSFINIGQNPYEMGRQAIFTLHNIVQGKEYKEIIYTPLTRCTQDNYQTCTKESK